MTRKPQQRYTLLLLGGILSIFSLTAQTPPPSKLRDTLNREVTIVSDKVLEIEHSAPIFARIPLTAPQVPPYHAATPPTTGDFTPQITPPATPLLSDYGAKVPSPYTGIMVRLYGGFSPTLGGDVSGRWAIPNKRSVLSFDLSHESELVVPFKLYQHWGTLQPVSKEGAEGEYFFQTLDRPLTIYQHATHGALSYALQWEETKLKARANVRSNIFDNRTKYTAQDRSIYPVDLKQWQHSLQEYQVDLYAQHLSLNQWNFNASVSYAYLSNSLPSSTPHKILTEEGLHRLSVSGQTVIDLSPDWLLSLDANYYSRTAVNHKSLSPSDQGLPQLDKIYPSISVLRLQPKFQYQGALGFDDYLKVSMGMGVDVSLANLGESVLYPLVDLSWSNRRSWEWYLKASGGLKDVDLFSYLSLHPGLSSPSLPQMDRQQLHAMTGFKCILGSTIFNLYGGYEYYLRTSWSRASHFGSFLLERENAYARAQCPFVGGDIEGMIAHQIEWHTGIVFRFPSTIGEQPKSPRNEHPSLPQMRPFASYSINLPAHQIYAQLRWLATSRWSIEGHVSAGFYAYSQRLWECTLSTLYKFNPNWSLLGSVSAQTQSTDIRMGIHHPWSARLGVQYQWSL